MMKLEDFVKETIEQLVSGVQSSRKKYSGAGADIVPKEVELTKTTGVLGTLPHTRIPVFAVEFDVAVTASESSASEGGAGVFVAGLAIGGKAKGSTTDSMVSRVRFVVPVTYPPPKK